MTYSVQHEIEQLAKSGKRSDRLIATFKEGYADNWYMAVRDCFRSQLDIKYTSRIENQSKGALKTEVKLWTQGPRIAFDKGHIFYDTPYGYQLWNEAIKHVKLACVVINGKPNDVKKEKSLNSKKNINKLIEGFVEVEILVPNIDKTKLIKREEKKMSQNEFVEFLMCGNLG
jgi:hypothetical protein